MYIPKYLQQLKVLSLEEKMIEDKINEIIDYLEGLKDIGYNTTKRPEDRDMGEYHTG